MADEWVSTQHRTMARWVSSKVNVQVTDLTQDLGDGTILIALVNILIDESGGGYTLQPVYKRPNFTLQKVENVDDFLKFCRLVLKINTCNISAEDVVGGNLKLILGLIWTLFVFLISRLASVSNDSRSIADIKTILIKWINTIVRSRALPEVTNFNKDWSLQQNNRPDLIFAAILDFYTQDLIVYDAYVSGKKYANLEILIALAKSQLDIPDLAESLDFNVLVPDEKCVILYLLQWYLCFEREEEESVPAEMPALRSSEDQVASFISHIVSAVRYRNKYETKALRLLNQMSTQTQKLRSQALFFENPQSLCALEQSLDSFCSLLLASELLEETLKNKQDCSFIIDQFSELFGRLDQVCQYKIEIKPMFCTTELPELNNLFRQALFELKKCGITTGYEPFKQLSLAHLLSKIESLDTIDHELCSAIQTQLSQLGLSALSNIDSNIEFLLKNLRARGKQVCDDTKRYAEALQQLRDCKVKLCHYEETIAQRFSISELQALLASIDTIEVPDTPDTPQDSEYMVFKDLVSGLKNQKNMTFYDLKQFLKNCLTQDSYNSTEVKEFTKLVPTRKLLTLSESDDFSCLLNLDDSDHSTNIFDRVLKTLEYKLSGTHNRLYDISLFISQLENGFCINS
ncbi:hypothetical protein PUMCH_002572 [Australozyma saopauloensis]|uniref:Calponin-homology (CH) domain-containing protein n=1 Tax=Australozyma saopauloensis TaxID=291208 RepID=A0AAX4H9Q1_9ASCO|nr:hypothetical protein PUMCH_002572 [[Candida] saopauloensis]